MNTRDEMIASLRADKARLQMRVRDLEVELRLAQAKLAAIGEAVFREDAIGAAVRTVRTVRVELEK